MGPCVIQSYSFRLALLWLLALPLCWCFGPILSSSSRAPVICDYLAGLFSPILLSLQTLNASRPAMSNRNIIQVNICHLTQYIISLQHVINIKNINEVFCIFFVLSIQIQCEFYTVRQSHFRPATLVLGGLVASALDSVGLWCVRFCPVWRTERCELHF